MYDKAVVKAPATSVVDGRSDVSVSVTSDLKDERIEDSIAANWGYLLADVVAPASTSRPLVPDISTSPSWSALRGGFG